MAEINAAEAESHGNYGRPDMPAAELVLQLEADWGPADDMQGYGWALLLELSGKSQHSPVNASTTASRPALTRGQNGSLLLSCIELSSTQFHGRTP